MKPSDEGQKNLGLLWSQWTMPRFQNREARVFRLAEDKRVIEMGAVSYWDTTGCRGLVRIKEDPQYLSISSLSHCCLK